MQREMIRKTGSLVGTSEFTVLAPIKRGLVPALEAVSYKSRVKRVLRTLHLGRTSAHEHELARVLSDAVERVGRIHSVSIRVLEPADQVMLAVVFDGPWEAYVRVIWQKVARLLDLIFHNTDHYPLGWESSFEDWSAWLRSVQTETAFLYTTPGLTVADTSHLRMLERLHRRAADPATQCAAARLVIPGAEAVARAALPLGYVAQPIDLNNPLHGGPPAMARPAYRHAARSLAGLHRLVEWHAPGTSDGEVLRRAAHELLPEFVDMTGSLFDVGRMQLAQRYPEALNWLEAAPDAKSAPHPARQPPALPPAPTVIAPDTVQAGVVTPLPDTDHGCLLLIACDTAPALGRLLAAALPRISHEGDTLAAGAITLNLGITPAGLRLAGVPENELLQLPEEFMQGMDSRAGWLGDLRTNHPRRWRLPMRNWADGVAAADTAETDPGQRISLDAVHVVLQLRHCSQAQCTLHGARQAILGTATDMLKALVESKDLRDLTDVHPLSLQWMGRLTPAASGSAATEHFGFADGSSNPVLRTDETGLRYRANQVHLGEVLCGYANQADTPPAERSDDAGRAAQALLHNGSFWVVRKLRQDVAALEALLTTASSGTGLDRETLLSKMMGRWPALDGSGQPAAKAGQPLATASSVSKPNDFNFSTDTDGQVCPLHAHMRLANPRVTRPAPFSRPARIVRRGMSYGPAADRSLTDPAARKHDLDQERGLVFMAYNASIGEQFEVVQRWLSGGNSSDGYSGRNDPFVGQPEPGHRRYFMCEHAGAPLRMALDGDDALQAEPTPLVRLEWGMYLLLPSRTALQRLQTLAASQGPQPVAAWDAVEGEHQIQRLQAVLQQAGLAEATLAWKLALEDPESAADFSAASIWAAIRQFHGGVLRTPYGVLVADKELVHTTLLDADGQLSANGYLARMRRTFGEMYLGIDAKQTGDGYPRESKHSNAAIMALPVADTFLAARETTHKALADLVGTVHDQAVQDGEAQWQLTLDLRELVDPVLAHFCEAWFGLSTKGNHFRRGGMHWDLWDEQPPWYPGHFLAPSRYVFQPHPGKTVEDYGARHGQEVRKALEALLLASGDDIVKARTATVACAVLDAGLDPPGTRTFSARTLAGAIMGFVPTVDGNLRRIANEWLRDGTLWRLRAQFAGQPSADLTMARQRLGSAFTAAMQLRAVPEVLWRTATVSHTLGDGAHRVTVQPGELVIVGLAASTQQRLVETSPPPAAADAAPGPELAAIFGGDRWASPAPTHACPGSRAAMAVMLGFFSALVESDLALRAGPGPLSLSLAGPATAPVLRKQSLSPVTTGAGTAAVAASPPQQLLKAIGDSWLAPPFLANAGMPTLAQALQPLGYALLPHEKDAWPLAGAGWRLQDLADKLTVVEDYLANIQAIAGAVPVAILLTAGGNDLVHGSSSTPAETPLYKILKPDTTAANGAGVQGVQAALDAFLAGLKRLYTRLIDTIITTCAAAELGEIPILIHAYDHPIPNANGYSNYKDPVKGDQYRVGPWLAQVFYAAGINDPAQQRADMHMLIDQLDNMVAHLAKDFPGRVHHVKLTGVLNSISGGQPEQLWENELHPTQAGFAALAEVFADSLATVLRKA